jgi:hypothetical protein
LGFLATVGFGAHDLFWKQPTPSVIHVQSSGDNSPNVVNNSGRVTIDSGDSSSNTEKPAQGTKQ